MKALVFDGELKFTDRAPVPRRAGEALVRVLAAGICNTDLEIVRGYGGFHGTLGHEFIGRVVESDDAALIGKRVVGEINAGCGACDLCLAGDPRHCPARTVLGIKGRPGAFAEYLSLPARNLLEVPDTVPDEMAVFVEPLAAAAHILDDVPLAPGARVAVIGDGKLGQMIVRALASSGCELVTVGKHETKLALAAAAGTKTVLLGPGAAADAELAARQVLAAGAGAFDVVVEASGSATGLPLAIAIARPRGVVVLKSTFASPTSVNLSPAVVNEVRIVGSRCGRFQPALDMLAGGLDLAPLISARYPLSEGRRAFEEAALPGAMKVLLKVD